MSLSNQNDVSIKNVNSIKNSASFKLQRDYSISLILPTKGEFLWRRFKWKSHRKWDNFALVYNVKLRMRKSEVVGRIYDERKFFVVVTVAVFVLNPFTAKCGQRQISSKFPNFIFSNFDKQIASCESTGRELSFEWSHHRMSSTDSKVRVSLQNSIKHSGSERVKLPYYVSFFFGFFQSSLILTT